MIWHGEFGRMPISQKMNGRDHNPYGFSVWMAGGGIKGGTTVGATDEFGYAAVENKKTVNDVHATVLHLLGLDHEKLTFPYNGRHMRLTDVSGKLFVKWLLRRRDRLLACVQAIIPLPDYSIKASWPQDPYPRERHRHPSVW